MNVPWRGLCLLLSLSLSAASAWSAESGSAARLLWYSTDGQVRLEVALDPPAAPGQDLATTPLMADRWFIPLPELDVPLLDGGAYSLSRERSSVTILDFWATWCAPCKKELPLLQALYDELREQGLEALAINVQEPADLARPWAEQLGLAMPLGSYSDEVKEAFPFTKLPLVIVVDKWGRMRARWDGYQQGFETKMAEFARTLLAETEPPSERIADLSAGGGLLEAGWSREMLGNVEGLSFVPAADGGGALLASVGRSLVIYDSSGETVRTWELEVAPGLPRTSRAADGEGYLAVTFRPGSDHLFILRMPEGIVEQATAPAPVFDAAPLGLSSMLLATYEGVVELSSGGELLRRLEDFGGAAAVRLEGDQDTRRTVVLELGGRLTWLAPDGRISARIQTSEDAWRLLARDEAPEGAGVLPMSVTAAVTGRFLARDGVQAALATADGRLLLVDPATGERMLEAVWPGISDLAAGDLDGDGSDELAVAAGSRISVLTASP